MKNEKYIKTTISFKYKIILALFATAIMTAYVTSHLWYMNSYNNAFNASIKYTSYKAKINVKEISDVIANAHNIASMLSTEKTVLSVLENRYQKYTKEWFNSVNELSRILKMSNSYVASTVNDISIMSAQGDLHSSSGTNISPTSINLPWVQNVFKSNKTFELVVTTPLPYQSVKTVPEHKLIFLCKPVVQDNVTIGIIIIDLKHTLLSQVLDVNLKTDLVFITEENGNIIYKSDLSITADNINDTEFKKSYENVKNGITITTEEIAVNNIKYLNVGATYMYSGWIFVYLVPTSVFKEDFIRTLPYMFMWMTVIMVVIMLLLILISKKIYENLNRLKISIGSISAGNLNALPNIRINDEIGQISQEFERMMIRVKEMMGTIKWHERNKRETELRMLQAQINPHFLYNTLNTIKYLADIQHISNISKVASAFIDLLKVYITNTDEYMTIENELEFIKNYMEIQKYKHMNKFSYAFKVDKETKSLSLLKFLLQPIVENAIFHGFEENNRESQNTIIIKIYLEKGRLKISVTDNGKGMTEQEIEYVLSRKGKADRSYGIGIANVIERIKLNYGQGYGVFIRSRVGIFTTLEMVLPVIREVRDDV